MAPPGDLRRCLTALATRPRRARWMEARLGRGRSIGNLWLAERYQKHGNLQRAVDELGWWLGAHGRVCPASLGACTLQAELADGSHVVGEVRLAEKPARVQKLSVQAPLGANPAALDAIARADWIVLGPGSFYTSTLATVLTPGITEALRSARAPKLLVPNLCAEDEKTDGFGPADYRRELRRHARIDALLTAVHGPHVSAGDRHDPVALADVLGEELARAS